MDQNPLPTQGVMWPLTSAIAVEKKTAYVLTILGNVTQYQRSDFGASTYLF